MTYRNSAQSFAKGQLANISQPMPSTHYRAIGPMYMHMYFVLLRQLLIPLSLTGALAREHVHAPCMIANY